MRLSSSPFLTVVSNIRSDSTYIRSHREYIRDQIISDGGSYDFANLWNRFGDSLKTSDANILVSMVPTQQIMERAHNAGRISKSALDLNGDETKLEMLRTVFNLATGNLDPKVDARFSSKESPSSQDNLKVANLQSHPLEIGMDFGGLTPTQILDVTTGTKIKVVKFERREYQKKVIYFIYISGILLTKSASEFVFK
jgi:hypothetical protein